MKKEKTIKDKRLEPSQLIIYRTEDGRTKLEVRLEGETVWMSQKLMAELFQKDIRTINEHLINIYGEGELQSQATIRKFRIVQSLPAQYGIDFMERRQGSHG